MDQAKMLRPGRAKTFKAGVGKCVYGGQIWQPHLLGELLHIGPIPKSGLTDFAACFYEISKALGLSQYRIQKGMRV